MAAVIRSIFETRVERYDMNMLKLSNGSALVDPASIHERFAAHFQQQHQEMVTVLSLMTIVLTGQSLMYLKIFSYCIQAIVLYRWISLLEFGSP